MDAQRHAQAALLPGKRPGTGGRLDPRAGLVRSVKTRPHLDPINGPFSP